jgi:hypothetical protein
MRVVLFGGWKGEWEIMIYTMVIRRLLWRCLRPGLYAHTTRALATGRYPLQSLNAKSGYLTNSGNKRIKMFATITNMMINTQNKGVFFFISRYASKNEKTSANADITATLFI